MGMKALAKASGHLEAMSLLHPHLADATIKSKLNVCFPPNQMETAMMLVGERAHLFLLILLQIMEII
jgi:hypothetical protein